MNDVDIKNIILSFTNHFEFQYQGEYCFIDPRSDHEIYLGYKDIDNTYKNIEDLMNDPVFDGKALKEIAGDIEII